MLSSQQKRSLKPAQGELTDNSTSVTSTTQNLKDTSSNPQQSQFEVEKKRGHLITALGRGDKGKTWFLRIVLERALSRSCSVIVADADPGNRTLADAMIASGRLKPLQPVDLTEAARIKFLQDMITLAESGQNIFLDAGGNDSTAINVAGPEIEERSLQAFSALWGIDSRISSFSNINFTITYLIGGDPHDLALLGRILDSPLSKENLLIVRNAGVLRAIGAAADDPWKLTEASPIYRRALQSGAKVMDLPAIPPSIPLRLAHTGESFRDAVAGNGSLATWERQAVQTLLVSVEAEIARLSIQAWLP